MCRYLRSKSCPARFDATGREAVFSSVGIVFCLSCGQCSYNLRLVDRRNALETSYHCSSCPCSTKRISPDEAFPTEELTHTRLSKAYNIATICKTKVKTNLTTRTCPHFLIMDSLDKLDNMDKLGKFKMAASGVAGTFSEVRDHGAPP